MTPSLRLSPPPPPGISIAITRHWFIANAATISVFLAIWLSGCNSNPASSIERVLQADKKIGEAFKASAPGDVSNDADLDRFVAATRESVRKQKAIDLSGCPSDFTSAYMEHIRAWEDFGSAIQQRPEIPSALKGFFTGLVRGLLGDITGGVGELSADLRAWAKEVQQAESRLKTSWRNTEDVALRYGAKLP